jgi:DNA-binding YbaB/EbfC family protein
MSESPGFGFGLGKIKDLQEAFRLAQQVQENAMNLQKLLETVIIEGKSSNGLVTVKMSGTQEPLATVLDDSVLEKNLEDIESLVLEAMKNAYFSSVENMKTKMEELVKELDSEITSQPKNTTSQPKNTTSQPKNTTSQPKNTTSQPKKNNSPIKSKNQSNSN